MKIIDNTNLGYLISKIKAAFWPKSDVVQIDIDDTPTANSNNLVKSGGVYSELADKYEKPSTGIPASDLASGVIPDVSDVVRTSSQSLTDAQKTQARTNIGIEDSVLVSSLTDYPEPYGLSNSKTLAQTATAFGVSESEIIAMSEGKYSQIKFGDNILGIDSIKVTEGLDQGEPWTMVFFGTTVGQSSLTSTKALVFIWGNAEHTSATTLMQSVEYENITNKVTSWQNNPDNTHYPSEKLVKDSLDEKYVKPSGGIPASDLAEGVIPNVSGKADKVSGATSNNFAGLDSNGNLTDSGKKASDFLQKYPYPSGNDYSILDTAKVGDVLCMDSGDSETFFVVQQKTSEPGNPEYCICSNWAGEHLFLITFEKVSGGSWEIISFNTYQAPQNPVQYSKQYPSSAEKEQARENIGAGTYSKPSGGIPASDLASGVIPTISTNIVADKTDDTKTASPKAVWDVIEDTALLDDTTTFSYEPVTVATTKNGVISQTITWTNNQYTLSNQVYGSIPQSNIDLFENCGASFNDTGADVTVTDLYGRSFTHKAGCFMMNGLGDLSYQEILTAYNYANISQPYAAANGVPSPRPLESSPARTNFWTFTQNWNTQVSFYMFACYNHTSNLTTVRLKNNDSDVYTGAMRQAFTSASRVEYIYPAIECSSQTGTGSAANSFYGAFDNMANLKEIRLKSLKISLSFKNSPNLSMNSIKYMIDNETSTSAFTITLHATAYNAAIADSGIQTSLSNHTNVTLASA